MSALQVPEHAPQLSQDVHAPSSEKRVRWRNNKIIRHLKSLTFTGSSFTGGSHAWSVTTIEHWTLPSIWITGSRTSSPAIPHRPSSFNLIRLNLVHDYLSSSQNYWFLPNILTITGSSISWCSRTRPVTTKKHLPLSHICIAGPSACTPTIPSGPISFIWNIGLESVVNYLILCTYIHKVQCLWKSQCRACYH